MTIRVLVVDDQPLVRTGIASVLRSDPMNEVVGEAADGLEALEMAERLEPDMVLMDIRMPHLDGLAATRRLVADRPGIRVVVLTTFDADEYVFEALASGASAFLLKDETPESILAAVRAVHSGHTLVAPAVTKRLVERWAQPRPKPELGQLTARELDVLRLVAKGSTNAEIAAALVVEDSTVKTHMSRLLSKLGARDRVQLVITAHEAGIV
jgi:DNA-binding NarL/FixJ family response regulator